RPPATIAVAWWSGYGVILTVRPHDRVVQPGSSLTRGDDEPAVHRLEVLSERWRAGNVVPLIETRVGVNWSQVQADVLPDGPVHRRGDQRLHAKPFCRGPGIDRMGPAGVGAVTVGDEPAGIARAAALAWERFPVGSPPCGIQ